MANFSKRNLWRFVNRRIKRIIHHYHVFSVMSILFEEMLKDLKQGKSIKIHNLGTISLQKTTPRNYHNVREKQIQQSKSHYVLRFFLSPHLRQKLCEDVELDNTSKDNYHE